MATRPALVRVLESLGHLALSAATGAEGAHELERLKGNVDVVLCDVHLRDANGWDLCLRLGARWSKPRFVLMSSNFRGLEAGGAVPDARYLLLTKPFAIADLAAVLRTSME
jgi:DNA-binding response OmpR family regulator